MLIKDLFLKGSDLLPETINLIFGLCLLIIGIISLTKTLILVDHDVNPKNYKEVLQSIRLNFNPESGFHLLSKTAADTLDFTSGTINRGSKMILDATTRKNVENTVSAIPIPGNLNEIIPDVYSHRFISNTLLVLQTKVLTQFIVL